MKLMVSYDCGGSYWPQAEAETVEELLAKAEEMKLNEQMLRWTIENEAGDIKHWGALHYQILAEVACARVQLAKP